MVLCLQTRYAALDAVCLLMLLDNLCQCAEPQQQAQDEASVLPTQLTTQLTTQHCQGAPDQHNSDPASSSKPLTDHLRRGTSPQQQQPQYEATPADTPSVDGQPASNRLCQHSSVHSAQAQQQQQHDDGASHQYASMQGPAEPKSTASQQTKEPQSRQGNSQTRQAPATTADYHQQPACKSDRQCSQGRGQPDSQKGPQTQVGFEAEAHRRAMRAAAELWGCRLEVTAEKAKPKAKKHMSRRQRAHIRHANEAENQINDVAGISLMSMQAWLLHFALCMTCQYLFCGIALSSGSLPQRCAEKLPCPLAFKKVL